MIPFSTSSLPTQLGYRSYCTGMGRNELAALLKGH